MAAKQESMADIWEYAKIVDKIEKNTVVPYVAITIEDTTEKKRLNIYQIRRELMFKYDWVIQWRLARHVCNNPRHHFAIYHSFYDKKTGLSYEFGSLLSQYVSAKAQITKAENRKNAYIQHMQTDLFFNPDDDGNLKKMDMKIKVYRSKVLEIEEELRKQVEKHQKDVQ